MNDFFYKIVGNGRFGLSKAMTIGLIIMVPILIVALIPFIVWFSIPADTRYSEKYYVLQDLMWIWPVCLVGLGFLGAIGWMIYNYLKDSGKIK